MRHLVSLSYCIVVYNTMHQSIQYMYMYSCIQIIQFKLIQAKGSQPVFPLKTDKSQITLQTGQWTPLSRDKSPLQLEVQFLFCHLQLLMFTGCTRQAHTCVQRTIQIVTKTGNHPIYQLYLLTLSITKRLISTVSFIRLVGL